METEGRGKWRMGFAWGVFTMVLLWAFVDGLRAGWGG